MITPSHIIYSWALAKKTEKTEVSDKKRTLAFVLGALFPDTPTYLFFVVCGLILQIPGNIMWGEMYFNSGWSIPITLTHSFIIWPLIIAISSYFGLKYMQYFSISALFHAMIDFCVHTEDAYRHFYPLSHWKFKSPISYWNSAEYGQYVIFLDGIIVIMLLLFLYKTYEVGNKKIRIGIICISVLYVAQIVIPVLQKI